MIRYSVCFLLLAMAGCASMRTTPVTRQDDDSYCRQCPANGVPVTVSLPTHLKVTVYEQLFYRLEDDDRIILVNKDCPKNYKVKSEQMLTEKVIFVDAKRAAAGQINYNLHFDSKGQSITRYESFVYDRTADDSANAIANLIPGAKPNPVGGPDFAYDANFVDDATTKANQQVTDAANKRRNKSAEFESRQPLLVDDAKKPAKFAKNIFTKERIVAFKIFDINSCDYEQQVQDFLAQHLNSCHTCETNPVGQAAATADQMIETQVEIPDLQ